MYGLQHCATQAARLKPCSEGMYSLCHVRPATFAHHHVNLDRVGMGLSRVQDKEVVVGAGAVRYATLSAGKSDMWLYVDIMPALFEKVQAPEILE